MSQRHFTIEVNGNEAIGLAILEQDQIRRQGIFVRHRFDQSSRLAFDLYLGTRNQPVSADDFITHPRIRCLQVSDTAGFDWPKDICLLISRRRWEIEREHAPEAFQRLPSFHSFVRYISEYRPSYEPKYRETNDTASWRGNFLAVTGVVISHPSVPPVLPSEADSTQFFRRWRFLTYLGLVDCDDDICMVNQRALQRFGATIDSPFGTCFFPSDRVLHKS